MTLTLRPYQREAIDSLYAYFGRESGNPLVVVPTGGGKSLIIATFIREALERWPSQRILCVTHVKELIEQNLLELLRAWPEAPAGIYSAGLNRRDTRSRIVFCGIQSVWKRAKDMQWADLLIVDEAHLIPRDATTMYGKFIDAMRSMNPRMKVIGLTATPYRLDSGLLTDGADALFQSVAYDVPLKLLVENGWLVPFRSKTTDTKLDTSRVAMRAGEFKADELEAACDIHPVNEAIADEIVFQGQNRKSWLVFGAGVRHASHLAEALRRRGVTVGTIFGDTDPHERRHTIDAFKRGDLRALCSMGVLTTGFNAPRVDLLALARPTASTCLYVQMVGRGGRTAPDKADCLVLDFGGNVERFGPVDAVEVRGGGKSKSEEPGPPPTKTCPGCKEIVGVACACCPACAFEFPPPPPPEEKLTTTASTANVMTFGKPEWVDVTWADYHRHEKEGKTPSMRADYGSGLFPLVSEWICFEHEGFAQRKAAQWWVRRGGEVPVPRSVDEALERRNEIRSPVRLQIQPDGKWKRVVGEELGEKPKPVAPWEVTKPVKPAAEEREECPF